MINLKKIIFILLIISSALATKNSFSASRVVGIAKALGKLGKRGKPGDDAPAGIAAPKPNVLKLPAAEKELVDLDDFYSAISNATPGEIPSDPFKTEEEQKKDTKCAAEAAHRASLPSDELAKLRKQKAATRAANLAKMLAKMTDAEREKYKEKIKNRQAAYRSKNKDNKVKLERTSMPAGELAALRKKEAAASAASHAKMLAKMTPDEQKKYNRKIEEAKAARRAKMTDEQLAEYNKTRAAAQAARLAKMTDEQLAEYNKTRAVAQAARRAKKKAVQAGTL